MNIFQNWFEKNTVLSHSTDNSLFPSPKLVSDVPVLYTDVRGMELQMDGQTNNVPMIKKLDALCDDRSEI